MKYWKKIYQWYPYTYEGVTFDSVSAVFSAKMWILLLDVPPFSASKKKQESK